MCNRRRALLAAAAGLMIANAQQSSAPAFIAGDHPVTLEQVREKLHGRVVQRHHLPQRQIHRAGKMAIDSETGRFDAATDDDDD